VVEMREPDVPKSLTSPRRAIVALIAVAAVAAIAMTIRDGALASRWTDALGVLLGALAGTFVGERLAYISGRVSATWLGWVQMATIGLLIVGAVSWQALPDYCRLPVSFAMGLVIVAATVYVQRLRMRLP
jgi:hypothetical protein